MRKCMKAIAAAIIISLAMPGSIYGFVAGDLGNNISQAEAVTYMRSGRTAVAKMSAAELAAAYRAIRPVDPALYSTTPITGSSYRIGKLSSPSLLHVKDTINFYRSAAGLGKVSFDSALNTSASYAALANAMNMSMSHSPAKPAAMSSGDYQKACEGAQYSNLSGLYFTASSVSPSTTVNNYKKKILDSAITGQMSDSDTSNIRMLGHRRWLLNPNAKTMGVGCADNHNSSNYYQFHTAVRVTGPGVTTANATDYDFIAWPASGYNLSDTFAKDDAWSITLNTARYKVPARSSVKVTLTRTSDGKVWNLNSSTTGTKPYFNVNTDGYGIANCIIFRPDYTDISKYSGTYTVHVTGLKKKDGTSASLDYKVIFKALSSIK